MAHYSTIAKIVIDVPPGAHDRERLERLGAERVSQVQSWWVMRDPAGLVFCVLPESPGSLTGENAQHWD